jgi:hypothetical protein
MRCVEKIDYQRMLLAKLLFNDKSASDSTALRVYYPEWALKLGVFKATYYHNARDRRRTEILFGELVAIEWRFNFKNEEQAQHVAQATSTRFTENFTMLSSFGQNMNWNVRVHHVYIIVLVVIMFIFITVCQEFKRRHHSRTSGAIPASHKQSPGGWLLADGQHVCVVRTDRHAGGARYFTVVVRTISQQQ